MNIGERIQKLRKENGYSQEQLAEKLNLSRQTISKWELNQSSPDLAMLVRLSELFNISIDFLIKGNDPVLEKEIRKKDQNSSNKWLKNLIIGCVFLIIGSIGTGVILLVASNNLVSSWWTPPGRLLTTIQALSLMPFLILSLLFFCAGILIMIVEYFKK